MDIVCFRTLGGSAARSAKLGTGPHERCCDDDLAGSYGTWGNDLGFHCHYSRSNLCLVRGRGSVPAKSASDRSTFHQLYAELRCWLEAASLPAEPPVCGGLLSSVFCLLSLYIL